MKIRLLFLAFVFFFYPAISTAEAPNKTYTQEISQEADPTNHNIYVNSKGNVVHSPSKTISSKAPDGASAKCRDGAFPFSQSRRGACSHHGALVSGCDINGLVKL